jgi:hypothetical protein
MTYGTSGARPKLSTLPTDNSRCSSSLTFHSFLSTVLYLTYGTDPKKQPNLFERMTHRKGGKGAKLRNETLIKKDRNMEEEEEEGTSETESLTEKIQYKEDEGDVSHSKTLVEEGAQQGQ